MTPAPGSVWVVDGRSDPAFLRGKVAIELEQGDVVLCLGPGGSRGHVYTVSVATPRGTGDMTVDWFTSAYMKLIVGANTDEVG